MYLEQQLGELSELLAACKETSLAAAQEAVRLTAQAIGAKKKLFLCGNGGSAATASHIANDLSCHMKNWQRDAYRIVCLNDSPAVLTSMTLATVWELPASLLVIITRSEMSGAME